MTCEYAKNYFERESGNDINPIATLSSAQQEDQSFNEYVDIKAQIN